MTAPPDAAGPRLRPAWILLAAGIGLRLALALLSGAMDYHADEAAYIDYALYLLRFGSLGDNGRFVWPPGYPFLIAQALDAFGATGILVLKLFQVALSGVVGATTILIARRLFDRRAALIAAALWAGHLPLATFTHLLWPETVFLALFLPALLLLLSALEDPRPGAATGALLGAGLLLGLAALFKEMVLWLVPIQAVVVAVAGRPGLVEGLRRASLLGLAAAAVMAPWVARNHEVYGRFTSTGITLGENVAKGLNASYVNFDTTALERDRETGGAPDAARRWFVDTRGIEPWKRDPGAHNVPDLSRAYVGRGLAFARANPGYVARTRVKRLADFVIPLSFAVRHHALGLYRGPLAASWARRPLIVLAVLASMIVMAAAVPGFCANLRQGRAGLLLGATLAYVLATGLLVASSRYRLPVVPILIALAAGHGSALIARERPPLPRRVAAGAGLALLAFLWWIDGPEVLAVLELVL